MNEEIYKVVIEIVNKLNTKVLKEDLIQDVILILIEKDLLNVELTTELRGIIYGIVRNQNYKTFNKEVKESEFPEDFNAPFKGVDENDLTEDEKNKAIIEHLSKIRRYVFKHYYNKGKSFLKWKIWYLHYRGYSTKEISKRLDFNDTVYIYNNISLVSIEVERIITRKNIIQMFDLNKNLIKEFDNIYEASKETGLHIARINSNIYGINNTTGNFVFVKPNRTIKNKYNNKLKSIKL